MSAAFKSIDCDEPPSRRLLPTVVDWHIGAPSLPTQLTALLGKPSVATSSLT